MQSLPSKPLQELATNSLALYQRVVDHGVDLKGRKKQTRQAYEQYESLKKKLDEKVDGFYSQKKKNIRLIEHWRTVDTAQFGVAEIANVEGPRSVDECVEFAADAISHMKEQGHPDQDFDGKLERVGKYLWMFLTKLFEVTSIGVLIIISGYVVTGPVYLVCVLLLASFSDMSLPLALSTPLFVVLGLFLSLAIIQSSSDILEAAEKEYRRVQAGCKAYLKFEQADDCLDDWYKHELMQIEDQIQNEVSAAKQIDLDENVEKEKIQAEFSVLFQKAKTLPSISNWKDPIWVASPSKVLSIDGALDCSPMDVIRLGEIRVPYPVEAKLPFLVNLSQCGHVFIKTTNATLRYGVELLKSITARLVFNTPLLSTKFIFIDTKTTGTFSLYRALPDQLGNYDYSSADEILEQMKSLEFHKKRVQGRLGNKSLEIYNQNANAPEMYQVLCISGFPNAKRFTSEALGYLENIIESGPQAGIHVIMLVNEQDDDFSQLSPSLTKALQMGAVLTHYGNDCHFSFDRKSYTFFPDPAPNISVFDNLLPQMRALVSERTLKTLATARNASDAMNVFLCHSSKDKGLVREIYRKLHGENWLRPWLDEENLLPGEDWELEIKEAVTRSDVVIVFLSGNSVTKQGYVHKELRIALDVALEKPEGAIFIIPLRLDDCDVPSRLSGLQWVDYFPYEQREEKYRRLLKALRARYEETRSPH